MRRIVLFYVVAAFCSACSPAVAQEQAGIAEKVYRRIYEARPQEWYRSQAKLWRAETLRMPNRAEAWYNLYIATEYGHLSENEEENRAALQAILEDIKRALPNSYEYAYLSSRLHQDQELEFLERAHRIQPDNPEPLYGLISGNMLAGPGHYEIAEKYLQMLYDSRDIAPGLLEYNYNVLMSVPRDGILLTNGDNDTYPAWVLQIVKSIRRDVTVVNVSMAQHSDYLDRLLRQANLPIRLDADVPAGDKKKWADAFVVKVAPKYPDRTVCFAFTLEQRYFEKFEDSLFITGLVYQYSPDSRLDNLALLRKHVGKAFRLDNLSEEWYGEFYPASSAILRLNANYVTPFLLLADHYRVSGDLAESKHWRDLSFAVAEKAGSKELVKYIRTNY